MGNMQGVFDAFLVVAVAWIGLAATVALACHRQNRRVHDRG